MTMQDFMLRTDNEDQMDVALEAVGALEEAEIAPGEFALVSVGGFMVDRIGPIPATYNPDGTLNGSGDSRYHANLRVSVELTPAQIAALPTFDPEPTVPYRVFL